MKDPLGLTSVGESEQCPASDAEMGERERSYLRKLLWGKSGAAQENKLSHGQLMEKNKDS